MSIDLKCVLGYATYFNMFIICDSFCLFAKIYLRYFLSSKYLLVIQSATDAYQNQR